MSRTILDFDWDKEEDDEDYDIMEKLLDDLDLDKMAKIADQLMEHSKYRIWGGIIGTMMTTVIIMIFGVFAYTAWKDRQLEKTNTGGINKNDNSNTGGGFEEAERLVFIRRNNVKLEMPQIEK